MSALSRSALGRRWFLVGLAASVSGCGFRPVYGPRNGTVSLTQLDLGLIDVAVIPERSGQLLRQALQQRLTSPTEAMAKQFELSISFGISGEAIGVQSDSTVTRIRRAGTATWSLKRLDSASTPVTNGIARSLDGVNITNGQYFAVDLASEAAERRIADACADKITLQIAAFFVDHPSAG